MRKCVYCILVDSDSNEEVQFLKEVKKLLNEIKGHSNIEHLKIIAVIETIYQFAVDKKLDENNNVDKESQVPIHDDILRLFETNHPYELEEQDEDADNDDEMSESDGYQQQLIEEGTDESCENNLLFVSSWRPLGN